MSPGHAACGHSWGEKYLINFTINIFTQPISCENWEGWAWNVDFLNLCERQKAFESFFLQFFLVIKNIF